MGKRVKKKQGWYLRMSSNNTKIIIFALQTYGRLTEWLGSGLQNRLRRFESATDLNQSLARSARDFLFSSEACLQCWGLKTKKTWVAWSATGIGWMVPPNRITEGNPPPTSTNPLHAVPGIFCLYLKLANQYLWLLLAGQIIFTKYFGH